MIKTYVEFFHSGVICSDSSFMEVDDRYPSSLILPKNTFGFRFFDIEEITYSNGSIYKGNKHNYSSNYYYGQKYSLEEVKRYFPDKKILIDNMELNNFKAVVKTKFEQFIPLRDGDIVL